MNLAARTLAVGQALEEVRYVLRNSNLTEERVKSLRNAVNKLYDATVRLDIELVQEEKRFF
jgi:hypothetical protein